MIELATLKLVVNTVVVKLSPPDVLFRASKEKSDGEFVRVGTFPDGGFVEFKGKIRYNSIPTSPMLDPPEGNNPVKVAFLIVAAWFRTKSSPVSVSIFPVLAGLEAVPTFPSGTPLLKWNGEVAPT